jgi:hypothetical protein
MRKTEKIKKNKIKKNNRKRNSVSGGWPMTKNKRQSIKANNVTKMVDSRKATLKFFILSTGIIWRV